MPKVVNLAIDNSASKASPLKKRKPNPTNKSSAAQAKNVQDKAASAAFAQPFEAAPSPEITLFSKEASISFSAVLLPRIRGGHQTAALTPATAAATKEETQRAASAATPSQPMPRPTQARQLTSNVPSPKRHQLS
jgi:hypothetical protein